MENTVEHSDLIMILSRCLLIFGIAGLIVPLLHRFKISSVLGFLICGIALGPNAFVLLLPEETTLRNFLFVDPHNVKILGELGILSLLFMIGLDLSFEKLRAMKHHIFGLGSMQIVITGGIIALIASLFGNSLETSVIIGACFALSSTAIVMKLLEEHKADTKPVGRLSFSILLMQDLAVVPILVLVGVFSGSDSQPVFIALLEAMIIAAVCISGIYLLGHKILQPAIHKLRLAKNHDFLAAFTLLTVCSIALITQNVGLSAALGAFLAGLLLGETEFKKKIKNILSPLKTLLLGIFFISVGMMVDVTAILAAPMWLAISVIGIFILKAAVIYPLCRLFKIPHKRAAQTAVILSEPGEFALMVISVSLATGILANGPAQFFLLVTVIGMLCTPLVIRYMPYTKPLVEQKTHKAKS